MMCPKATKRTSPQVTAIDTYGHGSNGFIVTASDSVRTNQWRYWDDSLAITDYLDYLVGDHVGEETWLHHVTTKGDVDYMIGKSTVSPLKREVQKTRIALSRASGVVVFLRELVS
jgi:hypothetical protein